MSTVADFLLGFIEWNKEVDYAHVFLGIVVYFLLFWLAVSLWVIKDSVDRGVRRRYAVLLGFATFMLSMPFLLLYLLARPHFAEEFEEWHEGGVNVPIVNFTGEKGIEMSFELRVHPRNLSKVQNSDMKIGIEFNNDAKHIKVASEVKESVDAVKVVKGKKVKFFDNVKANLKDISGSVKSLFMKKEKVVVMAEDSEKTNKTDESDRSSKDSDKADSVDDILSNDSDKEEDKVVKSEKEDSNKEEDKK